MTLLRITALLVVALFATASSAAVHKVKAGESIQAAIDGFATATASGDGFAVTFDGAPDETHVAALAERLVGGGVAVHSLAPEKRDLETVFREVTAAAADAEGGEA